MDGGHLAGYMNINGGIIVLGQKNILRLEIGVNQTQLVQDYVIYQPICI
jgi:hypothetical protein